MTGSIMEATFSSEYDKLKRIYNHYYQNNGKVRVERDNGKRDRGKPRWTFENTVSKILEEGHVKSGRGERGM